MVVFLGVRDGAELLLSAQADKVAELIPPASAIGLRRFPHRLFQFIFGNLEPG
jgi:hypothetical protein